MTELEKQFNTDMLSIYSAAKKECGYNATRFLQMVSEKGGLITAKQLIHSDGGESGFTALVMHKRLDLSVEAHVLKPEYAELFTEEELQKCRERLEQYNYYV